MKPFYTCCFDPAPKCIFSAIDTTRPTNQSPAHPPTHYTHHTHTYTHTHAHAHALTHTQRYTRTHTCPGCDKCVRIIHSTQSFVVSAPCTVPFIDCAHVRVGVRMNVCVCVYVCVHACVYSCVSASVWICAARCWALQGRCTTFEPVCTCRGRHPTCGSSLSFRRHLGWCWQFA